MTLFTSGCNFNCKYCHNKSLIKKIEGNISEEEVFSYFQKRYHLLDALVVSGGEPTLYGQDLVHFAKHFKEKFPERLLKIDTNGSSPDMIRKLSQIADFCAMDFKALDYSPFSTVSMKGIEASLKEIQSFNHFEIRITLFPEYVNFENLSSIIEILRRNNINKITLQKYRPLEINERNFSDYEIKKINDIICNNGVNSIIRGV